MFLGFRKKEIVAFWHELTFSLFWVYLSVSRQAMDLLFIDVCLVYQKLIMKNHLKPRYPDWKKNLCKKKIIDISCFLIVLTLYLKPLFINFKQTEAVIVEKYNLRSKESIKSNFELVWLDFYAAMRKVINSKFHGILNH